jgi:hypothetical protein
MTACEATLRTHDLTGADARLPALRDRLTPEGAPAMTRLEQVRARIRGDALERGSNAEGAGRVAGVR